MIVPNAAAACPYRVGDYLFSESATHPSTSWPGTSWVQVQERTILGASEDYPVGSEGGEAQHTLTEDELPEISGNIYAGSGTAPPSGEGIGAFRSGEGVFSVSQERAKGLVNSGNTAWPGGSAYAYANLEFGGGQPHNNLMPYRAAYIWRRTA